MVISHNQAVQIYNTLLQKESILGLYKASIAKSNAHYTYEKSDDDMCYLKPVDGDKTLSLYNHTKDVIIEAVNYINSRENSFNKYLKYLNEISEKVVTKDAIINLIIKTIAFHDFGKSDKVWQDAINSDSLLRVGYRHETGSIVRKNLLKDYDTYKSNIILINSILAHHNNLSLNKSKISKFDKCNKIEISKILLEYNRLLQQELGQKDIIKLYRKQSFVRMLLQFADRRASALEGGGNIVNQQTIGLNNNLININFNNFKPKKLQTLAQNSTADITILRAPTGAGKTIASLLWANKIINENNLERVIITMPTQFTSNSLATSISNEKLTTVEPIVNHSSIKFSNINRKAGDDKDKMFEINSYASTFDHPITICTIDQLMSSILLARDEHNARLFNISNSCVVIDEADFYDDFITSNIIETIKFLSKFGVKFLIMSATLPNSFYELLKLKINENSDVQYTVDFKDDETDNIRDRIKICDFTTNELSVYGKLKNEKELIIYCNTIERAKFAYDYFKKHREDVILYHSQYVRTDKEKIEDEILKYHGKEAVLNGTSKGVVIMTQIGELSINISAPIIISDVCPFDRLVQRFGRGQRYTKDICEVYIIDVQNEKGSYPAPYGHYDMEKRGWVANEYYSKTISELNDVLEKSKNLLNFNDYINIINRIYDKIEINAICLDNSRKLISNFNNNININPSFNYEDVDNNNSSWKSRNIAKQFEVLVCEVNDKYYDSKVLEKLIFENSINIPEYNFIKYITNGIVLKKENIKIMKNDGEKEFYKPVYYLSDLKLYTDRGLNIDEIDAIIMLNNNENHIII